MYEKVDEYEQGHGRGGSVLGILEAAWRVLGLVSVVDVVMWWSEC